MSAPRLLSEAERELLQLGKNGVAAWGLARYEDTLRAAEERALAAEARVRALEEALSEALSEALGRA